MIGSFAFGFLLCFFILVTQYSKINSDHKHDHKICKKCICEKKCNCVHEKQCADKCLCN